MLETSLDLPVVANSQPRAAILPAADFLSMAFPCFGALLAVDNSEERPPFCGALEGHVPVGSMVGSQVF